MIIRSQHAVLSKLAVSRTLHSNIRHIYTTTLQINVYILTI